jgi:hypothetical protein
MASWAKSGETAVNPYKKLNSQVPEAEVDQQIGIYRWM